MYLWKSLLFDCVCNPHSIAVELFSRPENSTEVFVSMTQEEGEM